MSDGVIWKIVEANNVLNATALAAGSIEQIVSAPDRVSHFNFLHVQNRDAVDIAILLDNQTTQGKYWEVQANGGIITINPDDGVVYKQIMQKNLDGATAETAGKILFSFAKKIPSLGVE
jgi:hypothetical protein